MNSKKENFIYIVSGIITIISALLFVIIENKAVYPFALGAAGMTFIKIKQLKYSNNFRIKRLQRIQAISTILLLTTVYLMYKNENAWVVTLLLSAGIDLIVSYRMPAGKE